MSEQKNLLIALALSAVVLLGWEYFYAAPQRAAFEAEIAAQAPAEVVAPENTDIAPADIGAQAEGVSLATREEAGALQLIAFYLYRCSGILSAFSRLHLEHTAIVFSIESSPPLDRGII